MAPADGSSAAPRVGVYIDYRFREVGGRVSTERAFALFLFALAPHVGRLQLIGRFDETPEPYDYELPPEVGLVRLPGYDSLRRPLRALPALLRGLTRLWRALDDLDVVWALGPNPQAIALAAMGV